MREQIGARFVTEPRIKLGEEGGRFHEIRLLTDQLDHFLQQIPIGTHVEGGVVQADQVAVLRSTTEVRVGGLETTRGCTVLSGIDQGLDGLHFRAEFNPRHVSLKTMMPFSAENRHLEPPPFRRSR
jgi:hypothetical protein